MSTMLNFVAIGNNTLHYYQLAP